MIKTPLRFDGQGINDADGQRLAKVSIAQYVDNPEYKNGNSAIKRNPDFDYLSRLFQHSPEMLELLKDVSQYLTAEGIMGITTKKIEMIISKVEHG